MILLHFHNGDGYIIPFWAQAIFIDSFSDPVLQEGGGVFIIEELPNPRDSGVFKILCGSAQIALDEPGVFTANQLISLYVGRHHA